MIFARYLVLRSVTGLRSELEKSGVRTKRRVASTGKEVGGFVLGRGTLYHLLSNPFYIGKVAHKGKLYDGVHEAIVDQATWDRSRELLRENTVKRRRSKNLPSGRMLHGKLASEDGRLYTPTHSAKGGRRYFYYTLLSQAGATRSVRSLPAVEIEARVIDSLGSLLEDAVHLSEHFSDLSISETRMLMSAGTHCSTHLRDGAEQEKIPNTDEEITDKEEMTGNYEVGCGKPPKSTRFKKGVSGNPLAAPRNC